MGHSDIRSETFEFVLLVVEIVLESVFEGVLGIELDHSDRPGSSCPEHNAQYQLHHLQCIHRVGADSPQATPAKHYSQAPGSADSRVGLDGPDQEHGVVQIREVSE